jgi:hypothetical protein
VIRIFADAERPVVREILMRPLKTSCFVWFDGDFAVHDLTDEQRRIDPVERQILSALKTVPRALSGIQAPLGFTDADITAAAESLVAGGFLVPAAEDESARFAVTRVDIETISHCNARCGFCPQSNDPKPRQVMTIELFEEIARKIAPYAPRAVALNNFSEPLLDPMFVERCRILEHHGLTVALLTNATVLRPAVLDICGTRTYCSRSPSICRATMPRSGPA